jgi:hypothetical protein
VTQRSRKRMKMKTRRRATAVQRADKRVLRVEQEVAKKSRM